MSSAPLLSYELVTHFPTKLGNTRIMVDRSGAVKVQRNDTEPSSGDLWSAPFPEKPLTVVKDAEPRLTKALEQGGFFSMAPRQVNEAATDGTLQKLTWTGKGGPRSVTIDRARSPQFDALRAEILRQLGLEHLG